MFYAYIIRTPVCTKETQKEVKTKTHIRAERQTFKYLHYLCEEKNTYKRVSWRRNSLLYKNPMRQISDFKMEFLNKQINCFDVGIFTNF